MDRSVSSHCGRGRPASWAALVVCLALAGSVASPPGASAAALAGAWGARVGSGGANGTATLRVLADATGSLALALAKLQPSASLTVRIHKGTCGSVGPVVASLPSIRTTAAGAASRTSGLTASQARAVGAATAGTGRIALRVGSGSSVRCGAFTVIPPDVAVAVSGATEPMSTGTTRTFTAAVTGTSETGVTWSVVEKGGGSITQDGVYTAPALPGTYTVRATSTVDVRASTPIRVPVVIPVGHIPGYDVGVDYHSYGVDFHSTAFITQYQDPAVRQTVRTQLQGMADRGATVISTRIWFVTEPGTTNFGDTWRATFPMSDQEKANLRAYAQDVAAIVGAGGNRLRLDLCLLWLGAADYTRGTLASGLGWTPLAPTEFARRVAATTDKVLVAVAGVKRPDGVLVVDTIYLDGEVMIGDKANQEWFLTTHYPRFVARVSAAGFRPSVYFATGGPQGNVLDDGYVDVDYPILNNHRSMYSIYRNLRFMADHGLPLPQRVDFSYYVSSSGASQAALLSRVLDDADATLPSLGLPKSYGIAETFYYVDATPRREIGQAIAAQAAANSRLQRVTFWTPGWGPTGSDLGYPFAIEDFYPPAN
jgi:hypothetical protein